MILGFTYAATLIVLVALVWIVVARPHMLVRPSVMFLGLFWLQVQFASAVNAHLIYPGLDRPWAFAMVIHGFALAVLAGILPTFRDTTRRVSSRLLGFDSMPIGALVWPLAVLSMAIMGIAVFYLMRVPFAQTGLYALLFDPGGLDVAREQSMKLLDSAAVAYSFAIMEKVLAPLASGFAAAAAVKAWRSRRRLLSAAFLLWISGIALPTLLYGARGPLTMVVLAGLVTVIVLHLDRLRLRHLAIAAVFCLIPISLISTLKGEFSLRAVAHETANIFDRAIGRGHIDNAWHLSHVERNGYHGVGGIEKLAPLFHVEPVDILNVVGREYGTKGMSAGLAFFGVSEPPQPCQIRLTCPGEKMAIGDSASAGAAFQTLNFAMFGWWSLPFSIAFVLALDLLLYAYLRMPAVSLAPVIGAMSVPVLGLCFSLMTTTLASRGLLLIPIVGALVGSISHLPYRTSPASGCR